MAYLCRARDERVSDSWMPWLRQSVRRFVLGGVCLLVVFAGQACHNNSRFAPATTLVLIDQSWVDMQQEHRLNEELNLFASQSGIRVQVLSGPEGADEQLITWRKLLESGTEGPDVYGIDVIWPGILADNLLDLTPYVPAQEITAFFPELIANNTVNRRLVALPYNVNEGLLFYRVDLLQQYGYRRPPKSWQELEAMAWRIQAGERAKGNKDFWGFVWQGAPSEHLTCNALEWQVSEGGGTILDEKAGVTVNNPNAVRAWDRAARWVGFISPPGVIAYRERDTLNVWEAGNAAFMRNWATAYPVSRDENSLIKDRFDIAPLPRGRLGMVATLGGKGYGVSHHSRHAREAAMLVRFLCSRQQQLRRCRNSAEPPTIPELYSDPQVLAGNPEFPRVLEVFRKGAALRPSRSAGKMYPDVSRAYFETVNAVLSRKKRAPQAAADLQGELVRMLKTSASTANATPYQGAAAPRQ
jgi:trehalose/maltose transport system substrate-binding protein